MRERLRDEKHPDGRVDHGGPSLISLPPTSALAAPGEAWHHSATELEAMNGLLNLPGIKNQTAFNLDRWDELGADERLAKLDWRIETDRHGSVIMNYPAEYSHGGRQGDIVTLLNRFLVPCFQTDGG